MSNKYFNGDNITAQSEYFGIGALPETVTTTMAYIPFQTDTTEYTPESALSCGTLFADLNKPFLGGKCI